MRVEWQIISIYSATSGALDDLPVESVRKFEKEFLAYVADKYPDVPVKIAETKTFSEDIEENLKRALGEFKATFQP
jgi:F-type H+-transporting ATPase subunit alpha